MTLSKLSYMYICKHCNQNGQIVKKFENNLIKD